MDRVTHIAPHFPPQIDGLGDYSLLLARRLSADHGIESLFLVGDPAWQAAPGRGDFPAAAIGRRSAVELEQSLGDAATVLLHYVGYGYAAHGVPLWLVRGLENWKLRRPGRRLVVVFHELWSGGLPWRRAFYLAPWQRRLVVRLHRLNDAAVTSVPRMRRRLDAIRPGKTLLQPIPSSLPPIRPGERALHRGGALRAATFGRAPTRLLGLRAHENLLRALHREESLAGVRLIGQDARIGSSPSPDAAFLGRFLPPAMIEAAADVSPEEGSALLGRSDLFLSFYPAAIAGKSSTVNAALGCGCVPVLRDGAEAEPLEEGREFLACDGSEASIRRIMRRIASPGLASLAEAGARWYDTCASWPVAARRMAPLLRP